MSARPRQRWLALLVLVLLAHLLAINWVGDQLRRASLLPKMTEPMFTRLLQQQAPPEQVAVAPLALPSPVLRPRVRSIPAETAAKPARAASQPKRPRESGAQRPVTASAAPADDLARAEAASTAAAAVAPVASAPQPGASAAVAGPRAPASAATPSVPASAAAPALAAASAAAAAAPASASAASAPAIGLALDGWPTDTRLNYRLGGNYRGRLHGSARVQWLR